MFFYLRYNIQRGILIKKDSVGYFMVIITNKELRIRSFDRLLHLKEGQRADHYSYHGEAVIISFKDYSSRRTASLDRLRL